jgi:ATP synthase protein I
MAIERKVPNERPGAWDDPDDDEAAAFRPLTREEASALRARQPSISPWRVVGMQAVVGAGVALLAVLLSGKWEIVWSALYGVAAVLVPGALMARGMTSPLSRVTPGSSAVSVMSWSLVKIGVSIAMLLMAPKLVQPLSWPALLAAMVLCMQVYWVALLWRGRQGH